MSFHSASSEDTARAVAYLRTPRAIRERCEAILDAALTKRLDHFSVQLDRLDDVAAHVVAVTRRRYPDLDIPLHSRWGHFGVGGVDRLARFRELLAASGASPGECVRSHLDLVVVSVLLDAGSGPGWQYRETHTGLVFRRSEGLAVATFDAFLAGHFSSSPDVPLRVNADALAAMDEETLGSVFQVTPDNLLAGLDGRTELLRRLAAALRGSPQLFGEVDVRPGNLYDTLAREQRGASLPVSELFGWILESLAPIWPGRLALGGANLGDVWRHPAAGGRGADAQLVPFHKLTQWLVYSLLEPLEGGGIVLEGLGDLTGLAEYRNGGLLVDHGVIEPRHPDVTESTHEPGAPAIVEWRALTVALLERLRPLVAVSLGLDESRFPAAKVLEGGTWAAGREIAATLRPGGGPPLRVESDGTVF